MNTDVGDTRSIKQDSIEVVYAIKEKEVVLVQKNTFFNCCLDTILVELTQQNNTIKITEHEIATNPCRCICPYSVNIIFKVPDYGAYNVEIWIEDRVIWKKEINVNR